VQLHRKIKFFGRDSFALFAAILQASTCHHMVWVGALYGYSPNNAPNWQRQARYGWGKTWFSWNWTNEPGGYSP